MAAHQSHGRGPSHRRWFCPSTPASPTPPSFSRYFSRPIRQGYLPHLESSTPSAGTHSPAASAQPVSALSIERALARRHRSHRHPHKDVNCHPPPLPEAFLSPTGGTPLPTPAASKSSSLFSPTSPLPNAMDEALPAKRANKAIRILLFTILTPYNCLMGLLFLANAITVAVLYACSPDHSVSDSRLATLTSTNLLLAILARHDLLIKLIFAAAWAMPWSAPLWLRCLAARVYAYGGMHSGAAVAGTIWFAVFTVVSTDHFARRGEYSVPIIVVAWAVLMLLTSIIALATPRVREKQHNAFEIVHRFAGWSVVLLFWAQVVLLSNESRQKLNKEGKAAPSLASALAAEPSFWMLIVISALIVSPWLMLRKITLIKQGLSNHAARLFVPRDFPYFTTVAISKSPLWEWHPFAVFPTVDWRKMLGLSLAKEEPSPEDGIVPTLDSATEPTCSFIVSAAGDFTKELIASPDQKPAFWIKGWRKPGVLSLSHLFPRIVMLTTGSGIGPCLSYLLCRAASPAEKGYAKQFCRLIWVTPTPHVTFGQEIVDTVRHVDPDALIVETKAQGRPDLIKLVWSVLRETNSEAAFVLSNRNVTDMVVRGVESRGGNAFGPIWDS